MKFLFLISIHFVCFELYCASVGMSAEAVGEPFLPRGGKFIVVTVENSRHVSRTFSFPSKGMTPALQEKLKAIKRNSTKDPAYKTIRYAAYAGDEEALKVYLRFISDSQAIVNKICESVPRSMLLVAELYMNSLDYVRASVYMEKYFQYLKKNKIKPDSDDLLKLRAEILLRAATLPKDFQKANAAVEGYLQTPKAILNKEVTLGVIYSFYHELFYKLLSKGLRDDATEFKNFLEASTKKKPLTDKRMEARINAANDAFVNFESDARVAEKKSGKRKRES